MHVLIDARPLSRGGRSGIPLYAKEVINHLITHSQDQFSIYYPGFRNAPLPRAWYALQNVSLIESRIPNRLLDLSYYLLNQPAVAKRIHADVVYSPHMNGIVTDSIPHLLTVHDISFAHYPQFFSFTQRYWHALQKWEYRLRAAQQIIAVSQYTKSDIHETLDIPLDRITVIHPGVDTSFLPLDAHDYRLLQFQKRHSLAAPYVLYLGALEKRKNVLEIIVAFDLLRTNPRFKDFELILAGVPGFGAYEILRVVRRSRSASHIRILSGIADEERVLLYNGAVAFVYPSFFEGFGFPPLEAQACGVPTVVSNRASLSEIAGTSMIQVNPWKPSELADALALLVVSGTERTRLTKEGLINAKRFSWETSHKKLYSLIAAAAQKYE